MSTGHTLSRDKINTPGATRASQFLAWNGLQLHVPAEWHLHVRGHRHLVFEEDFQPQVQIRWEREGSKITSRTESKLTTAISRLGPVLPELPAPWRRLPERFSHVTAYRQDSGQPGGLYCFCQECRTIFLVQLLSTSRNVADEIAHCLLALCCHQRHHTLWRIQDFSLCTPTSFSLTDYTFGAGLTRLSFSQGGLFLHTCRLAPADGRLNQQSLEGILLALAGTSELEVTSNDTNLCHGFRSPSLGRQLFFRMRREKPFLWAKIWHDKVKNRLLAVLLASTRPIPEKTAATICKHYEIV
ncbi:MAG: hypothetical protein ACWGOX_16150 [Desulforhopalus sp.]